MISNPVASELILPKVRTRQCRFPTINRAIVTSGTIAIDYFAVGKWLLECPPFLNSQQSSVNRQQSND
ncbi:MAG: hypothetical protein JGK38_30490 [Microcoleus sp. PH2017_15_JOR_U_A]|nr:MULTISPECIES: hypothetical protein [unclassified Microcoleus]MCC3411986.1 hypothetical protein [Microcoleus sp. PH2017_02_FOX_O_A]MCC3493935.1 hypothetical protein [Microcoleus sp. PH2017_16_JOR_D_A]MCC3500855.1 hypothetical protein [Microcoleus sp. PH2017_15_JOR_U_A]MCC3519012.1 hypothetical protein [Microcoleus sp. PH2017_18_LLB_O_A]